MRRTGRWRVARCVALIVTLALVTGWGTVLGADPSGQVNIGGATLFSDFFKAPASTNDCIDVDDDGVHGFDPSTPPYVDQLASDYPLSTYWTVQFRGIGSGNGLAELVAYYNTQPVQTSTLFTPASEFAVINRTTFAQNGAIVSPPGVTGDPTNHPGGTPVTPTRVDIAVMDVPTKWFVKSGSASAASWSAKPGTNGYGQCPTTSWDTGYTNQLKSLGGLNLKAQDGDPNTTPDANSVYDTQVAWVPVAIIANAGVGKENITQSELQHLYVTGRMPNGENLVAATRESGSGTRNAAMNSLGVDASWGVGDNLGTKQDDAAKANLGPNTQSTNLGGSGVMENGVQQRRLAIGYTGLSGPSRAAFDAQAGNYEILSVMKTGGTVYVRATLENVLVNGDVNDGWQIGGAETMATVGNPMATAINASYPATEPNDPSMRSPAAAAYIRNVVESINDFVDSPGTSAQYNMPGEYLANTFFLNSAISALPSASDPTVFTSNSGLNTDLQTYTLANNELIVPAYGSVNPSGFCPKRNALTGGTTYSDGSTTGSYTDAAGSIVTSSQKLSERNKIMGDFNYAGAEKHARNINDIDKMMQSLNNPGAFEAGVDHGGYTGTQTGDYVIVEVIGDFNGDGNFDHKDIRYFADGLATDPNTGHLNRKEGFRRVDLAWASLDPSGRHFFTDPNRVPTPCTLATGVAYTAGAAMADVAGGTVARGADPRGSDGIVDAKDLDYVLRNYGDWSNLDQASHMDLSCDMNGDLVVNTQDLNEVLGVLNTKQGDANLDGRVNGGDLALMGGGWMLTAQTWATCDFTGDGKVDGGDLALLGGTWNWSNSPAPADVALPEPATLLLLVGGAVALVGRCRRGS